LTVASCQHPLRLTLTTVLLGTLLSVQAPAQEKERAANGAGQPILWRDPGEISSKNLFYGVGGEKSMPALPVKFLSEDSAGISPKFEAEDKAHQKWKAKLALEAQSETVVSRLLWAVGYFANENYYYAQLPVENLAQLKRGQEFETPNGVKGARLQRHQLGTNKGQWDWKKNPFYGTREFNGLRVMMALVRNWDLMADNNAIFEDGSGREIYEVTDVGASFGKTGPSYSDKKAKNNLESFSRGKFISKVTADHVDFKFPTRPPLIFIFMPKSFFKEAHTSWIGKHIPRADVKWIAGLLSQLTPAQIRDAFRAGGYTPEQVEGFAQVVEKRISELNRL
jgi:hypothetical protein